LFWRKIPVVISATWADDGSLIYSAAWGDPPQKLNPGDSKPQACTGLDADQNARSHINPTVISGERWVLYNVWSGGDQTDIHATHPGLPLLLCLFPGLAPWAFLSRPFWG